MKPKNASVEINFENDFLELGFIIDGKKTQSQTRLMYDSFPVHELIWYWMLNETKPLFYDMPFDNISIACQSGSHNEFKKVINSFTTITQQTNAAIERISHLHGATKDNDHLLLINVDGHYRYRGLYDHLHRAAPKRMIYMDMASGYNPVTRQWEASHLPMQLSDLIQFIIQNKIKKIISIISYFKN